MTAARPLLALAILAALAGTPCLAADATRLLVAVHPCSFTETEPAEEAVIRPKCATASSKFPWADLVPSGDVDAWLKKRPTPNCQRDRECLASMAKDLSANLALYISVAPRTPQGVRVSALIIDTDGRALVDQVWTFARPPKHEPEAIADLVVTAIHQIREPGDQPQPQVVSAQPADGAPPLSAASQPRPVSWVLPAALAGGGAVAGVAGLIARQLALADAYQFQAAFASGPVPPDAMESLLALRSSGEAKFTFASISYGVAAACLLSSGVLFGYKLITDEPSTPGALTLYPLADPKHATAGIGVTGTIP